MFKKNKKVNICIVLLSIAVLLWMGLIFHFSAQPAVQSDGLSKGITKDLVITGEKIGVVSKGKSVDKSFISYLDNVIRSCAHFFMFSVLGFLSYWFVHILKKRRLAIVSTFIFCAVYAILDEFHQHFVPGRATELSDFIVDCLGSVLGMLLFAILYKIYEKCRNKVQNHPI